MLFLVGWSIILPSCAPSAIGSGRDSDSGDQRSALKRVCRISDVLALNNTSTEKDAFFRDGRALERSRDPTSIGAASLSFLLISLRMPCAWLF
jgi:hypothetical protein